MDIALKVLWPDLGTDPEWIERFRRELVLAREITHKNVVRIHDIGESDGLRFLSMRLVEGGRRPAPAGRAVRRAASRHRHRAPSGLHGARGPAPRVPRRGGRSPKRRWCRRRRRRPAACSAWSRIWVSVSVPSWQPHRLRGRSRPSRTPPRWKRRAPTAKAESASAYEDALKILTSLDDKRGLAEFTIKEGTALTELGRLSEAKATLDAADPWVRETAITSSHRTITPRSRNGTSQRANPRPHDATGNAPSSWASGSPTAVLRAPVAGARSSWRGGRGGGGARPRVGDAQGRRAGRRAPARPRCRGAGARGAGPGQSARGG